MQLLLIYKYIKNRWLNDRIIRDKNLISMFLTLEKYSIEEKVARSDTVSINVAAS